LRWVAAFAARCASTVASSTPARDPAGARRMAPTYARAPRRRGARGLARGPQCGLSARRIDHRRASRGCRRIRRLLKILQGPSNEEGRGRYGCRFCRPERQVNFVFSLNASRLCSAINPQSDPRADPGRGQRAAVLGFCLRAKRRRHSSAENGAQRVHAAGRRGGSDPRTVKSPLGRISGPRGL
jgi:hypothetical protein